MKTVCTTLYHVARPMDKVFTNRLTLYLLDECCILTNENNVNSTDRLPPGLLKKPQVAR